MNTTSIKTSSVLFCLIVIAGLIAVNFVISQDQHIFKRGGQDSLFGGPILNPSPTAEAANIIEPLDQSVKNPGAVIFNDADALNQSSPSQNPLKNKDSSGDSN